LAPGVWFVGVPAAVGAAASFGGAALLQHHATHLVPEREPMNAALLRDLLSLPAFRFSLLAAVVGFGLQVLALHAAPLPVVQPLLVTGVMFYLGYAALFLRRPMDSGLVSGAALAVAGLAGFLLVASPSAGSASMSGAVVLPLGVGLAGLVLAALWAAARIPRRLRPLPLAAATAVCYGITAALVRSLTSISPMGVAAVLQHWQLYAVAVVGPLGFLLNQNALQEGRLGSVAVAVITVGDPLVSISLGIAWFDDTLRSGVWPVLGEVTTLAVMAGGIVLLTARAQQVAQAIRVRAEGERR
jgi:drug/metabolite transporter (DMT)-like permease